MLYTDHRLKMIVVMMWIIIMLFNRIDSAHADDFSQPKLMITADVGDNVTLHCFRLTKDSTGAIVWYKQQVGHKPRVMVAIQHESPSYEDEFKRLKFSIEKEQTNVHLKIANVEPSDEATYYCAYRNFLTRFGNGTYLAVKGDGDVKVSQIGVLDSVPAGASVTLQCSVLSESRAAELHVLWFRAAPPQSHPQIIYTHHNSSRQCESGSSTHTCVYNFTKNILSLNDTGTYYCAVAACGKIMFGDGIRVQMAKTEEPMDQVVVCLAVALGVCLLVIFALILIIIYKRRNSEQGNVRLKQDSVTDKSRNQDCDNELNYAALHFNKSQTKRGRVKKQQPQDIIYSDVRRSFKT